MDDKFKMPLPLEVSVAGDMFVVGHLGLLTTTQCHCLLTAVLGVGVMNLEIGTELDSMVGKDSHYLMHAMRHASAAATSDAASGGLPVVTQAHGFIVQPVFMDLADTVMQPQQQEEQQPSPPEQEPSSSATQPQQTPQEQGSSMEQQDGRRGIGGFLFGFFAFDTYLSNILSAGVRGIRVVIKNSCGNVFTYELNGNEVRVSS